MGHGRSPAFPANRGAARCWILRAASAPRTCSPTPSREIERSFTRVRLKPGFGHGVFGIVPLTIANRAVLRTMPESTNEHFRDAVVELMEERGWSQRELSAAVGVDPAHICRLLRRGSSRRATPDMLVRVARAFGVPPPYFSEYREWQGPGGRRAGPPPPPGRKP